jgi:DoxX-like family
MTRAISMNTGVIANSENPGSRRIWMGRVFSGLTTAFLLVDAIMKVVSARVSVEGTVQVGYPENVVVPIGIVLLICTVLYVIPRTSFLGAILLTGYLGGAVATQVRISAPLFGNILFPVYVGVLAWAGLYLRDPRLRKILL